MEGKMKQTKHTPGPWTVERCQEPEYRIQHHEIIIAWTGTRRWPSSLSSEENQANARLIAAAPELLEACRAMKAVSDKAKHGKGYDNEPGAWLDHAEAVRKVEQAIAKAEGREV